ncbi:MAG: hypothetical protein U0271_21370 [Polyangiaceae bacterium]
MKTTILRGALFLSLLGLVGCEQKDPKDAYAVSVDQQSSAMGAVDHVKVTVKRVQNGETKGNENIGKIPTLLDSVNETDVDVVLSIIEAADAAGKDGAYVATIRELEIAQAFFDSEQKEIVKKVGGSVQYAAKAKGCEVEAWGAVDTSLKDSVGERIDERLKDTNDAHLIIDRNVDALGKKNIAALETAADTIAETSYIVHVLMPDAKAMLEASIDSAGEARKHLQRYIEEEKKPPKEGVKVSADAQKGKDARAKAAEDKLKELDQAEADAKKALEGLEQRQKALESAYDAALDKLKASVKAKKKPS